MSVTDQEGNQEVKDAVSSLMRGVAEEMEGIRVLLDDEEAVRNGCKAIAWRHGRFRGRGSD